MRGLRKLTLIMCTIALTCALISMVKVHAASDGMKTFFDSRIPGITIQVNATTETRSSNNLTVAVSLEAQTAVGVEYFNLEVFGFINGTNKLSMLNISDDNFSINSTSPKQYMNSTTVAAWVWGTTYGEISLSYNASVEGLVLTFPNFVSGFPMTQVENTYLEGLQAQNIILQGQIKSLNDSYQQLTNLYKNLSNTFAQLNQTYVELNQTYVQLYQNYTSVKGSLGDLDNTRRVTTVLAVTTILFLVTTVYLVVRRPKVPW
jgi:hypothetical protein